MALPKGNLEHPCFPQPPNSEMRVWRYIDFVKLVSLLTTDQLHLVRVDLLPDRFEGFSGRHFSEQQREGIVRGLAQIETTKNPEELDRIANDMIGLFQKNTHQVRCCAYVSCWCATDGESEAMWRVYAGAGASVALVLPYAKLRDSLNDERLYIGSVSYFDYNREVVPWGNIFAPLMCKRREFQHEHEVRIVRLEHEYMHAAESHAKRPDVLSIHWPVAEFVNEIVISPYASRWQHEVILTTIARLKPELRERVRESEMGGEPE